MFKWLFGPKLTEAEKRARRRGVLIADLQTCRCMERRWEKPFFINHIDGPGWFTSCDVCHELLIIGKTRAEAEDVLSAYKESYNG